MFTQPLGATRGGFSCGLPSHRGVLFVAERIIGLRGPPSLLTEQSHQGCIQFSGFGSRMRASSDLSQTLGHIGIGSFTVSSSVFLFKAELSPGLVLKS